MQDGNPNNPDPRTQIKLKQTEPAPFFTANGDPLFQDNIQLVMPYAQAAFSNYKLATYLGLLPKHEADSFTPEELKEIRAQAAQTPIARLIDTIKILPPEDRAQLTSTIEKKLNQVSGRAISFDPANESAPLFMWRDSAVYGVTSDGYMLFNIRSNFTPRNVGKLSPTGCGFAHGDETLPVQETAQQGARRELFEETTLAINNVVDIGYVMRKPYPQFFELKTEEGGKVPGMLIGMAYIGAHRFDETLQELTEKINVGKESFGMIAVTQDQMTQMADGKTIQVKFLDSLTGFAQDIIGGAYSDGAKSLAQIGAFGTTKGVLSNSADNQTAHLRPANEASDILVSANDFIGDSNRLATGLHVLKQMGGSLSVSALSYVANFSPIDRLLSANLNDALPLPVTALQTKAVPS